MTRSLTSILTKTASALKTQIFYTYCDRDEQKAMRHQNTYEKTSILPLNNPTLVILAAGMGSRYGGLKQLDPVGPNGEVLLDYSIHDALQAGFNNIVFVIRKEIETTFKEHIKNRYAHYHQALKMRFVFQELTDLPTKNALPTMRTKPWGTGHALLAARHLVTSAFAVINADDYYGPSGYKLLANFFSHPPASTPILHHKSPSLTSDLNQQRAYAMVAYPLKKTLSEHGAVSRGMCEITENHDLIQITECPSIHTSDSRIVSEEKDHSSIPLTGEEWVSLNFWGFTPDIFSLLEEEFANFLTSQESLMTAEFYLPTAINNLIQKKKIAVKLIPTQDPWLGLTHPADITHVKHALSSLPV
jgi:UTP-glucose-1-phosphate uridylyltransferase